MTKMKVLKAAGFILTTIVTLFPLPPSTRANQSIQTLGKDSLGETVKQFRTHYGFTIPNSEPR